MHVSECMCERVCMCACVCVDICVSVQMTVGAYGRLERKLDLMELKFQAIMNHSVWVLETKLESLVRAAVTLSHRGIHHFSF